MTGKSFFDFEKCAECGLGVIFLQKTSFFFKNSTFSNCKSYNGGIFYIKDVSSSEEGSNTIDTCTFAYNSAQINGGGIYLDSTYINIINSLFLE